jgi:hypothetical protein
MTPGALPDPVAVAVDVAQCFERIGVAYVIGGSFASSLHGEPRSTNDIDFVADLDVSSARQFTESLGGGFYADADVASTAARAGGSFNLVHIETAIKIDVFVAGADALDAERLRRRQLARVDSPKGATALYVDTPEDIVLRKLEWYRRGGQVSERQWRDVVAVLGVQKHLDQSYLDTWAQRLGVGDLLRRAIAQAAAS